MIPYRNPLLVSCFRKPPRQTTRRHAQEYAYYHPVNLHISTELHGRRHQQSKFLPEHCHIHARKSFTSSQNMPIYGRLYQDASLCLTFPTSSSSLCVVLVYCIVTKCNIDLFRSRVVVASTIATGYHQSFLYPMPVHIAICGIVSMVAPSLLTLSLYLDWELCSLLLMPDHLPVIVKLFLNYQFQSNRLHGKGWMPGAYDMSVLETLHPRGISSNPRSRRNHRTNPVFCPIHHAFLRPGRCREKFGVAA